MPRRCRSSSWSTAVGTERLRPPIISKDSDNTESASRPFGGARFVVGGLVLAVGVALIVMSDAVPAPLARGDAAPYFELRLLDDSTLSSLSDYRGQVVLLNFWATWCKPCEDEMPAMERLYRELGDEGFELLALSVDEEATDVAVFRDRLGITFPILLDTEKEVSRLYQTTGYPESLLVGADGNIVERYVGPREWDDRLYVERIRALLSASAR